VSEYRKLAMGDVSEVCLELGTDDEDTEGPGLWLPDVGVKDMKVDSGRCIARVRVRECDWHL